MQFNLHNQTVLVTGGSRRVGKAIALTCAGAGANVAITYRNSAAEADSCVAEMRSRSPYSRFAAYQVELTDSLAVAQLAASLDQDFGGTTALVNSAGVFRRTPFETLTEQDFDFHVGSNLKAPFLLSKIFGDRFLAQGQGAIVNIADIHGLRPLANYIPYSVSKAGLVMLTEALAKALAPAVRVNCICPGTILEPSEDQGDAESVQDSIRRIPLGRIGTVEEIADTVLFLLAGPTFISGAILPVDGAQRLR